MSHKLGDIMTLNMGCGWLETAADVGKGNTALHNSENQKQIIILSKISFFWLRHTFSERLSKKLCLNNSAEKFSR